MCVYTYTKNQYQHRKRLKYNQLRGLNTDLLKNRAALLVSHIRIYIKFAPDKPSDQTTTCKSLINAPIHADKPHQTATSGPKKRGPEPVDLFYCDKYLPL